MQNYRMCQKKDKVWDKHRTNSNRVSEPYKGSKYQRYSNRIDYWSQFLDFKLSPDADQGFLRLKPSGVVFCRVRHCFVCQLTPSSLNFTRIGYATLPLGDALNKSRHRCSDF